MKQMNWWQLNALSLASLCLFVFSVWSFHYRMMTRESWGVPIEYWGDAWANLGYIKAVSQGDWTPLGVMQVHQLNAPSSAAWQNFPMYEKVPTIALGLLARHTSLGFASNVALIAARLSAAVGFWCAAFLILNCSRWWAWVGAVCFSLLYYHDWRGANHLLLQFTWTIPLFVAVTWIPLRPRWLLLISFLVGISNPYWVLGALILVVICRQSLRARVWLLCGLSIGFLLSHLATILWATKLDVFRTYADNERFALRPMELLLPPLGGLLGNVSRSFLTAIPTWQQGEMFSPYLGLVGIFALGLLVFDWIVRRQASLQFAQVCALTICSSIGGLTCLMALCGLPLFRAPNRLSEFIAAICLLYLVSRLSNRTHHDNHLV